MSWKKALKERNEIVLATSSKDGKPRAIVVISLGFVDNKLLIGACLMKTSLKNIRENNTVSIVAKHKDDYYRIDGQASIYSSGEYLVLALKKSDPPPPRCAIVVDIREVFDLDKGKKIF